MMVGMVIVVMGMIVVMEVTMVMVILRFYRKQLIVRDIVRAAVQDLLDELSTDPVVRQAGTEGFH